MKLCLLAVLLTACSLHAAERVVVVGVDGLGGRHLKAALERGDAPRIKALLSKTAYTLQARAVIPTSSSPNWASMIMGAGPSDTGITDNDWEINKHDVNPACAGASPNHFPTVYGEIRKQKPKLRMAIFHDWEDYARLVEPGVVPVVRHEKGSPATMRAAIQYWKEQRPELLFIHLDDVDHAGHEHGWKTQQYAEAVRMVDGLIGELLDVVDEKTALLITADHGGIEKKHGGLSADEIHIPWILRASGIKTGERQGIIRTYDTAATLAGLLGVKPHACWVGKDVASKDIR